MSIPCLASLSIYVQSYWESHGGGIVALATNGAAKKRRTRRRFFEEPAYLRLAFSSMREARSLASSATCLAA